MRATDLTGRRFGRLVVVNRVENMGNHAAWSCECDCGNRVVIRAKSMRSGQTSSCGCLFREVSSKRVTSHGLSRTPEHRAWNAMKTRCSNKKYPHFKSYGGRGITVCDRWMNSFDAFYNDMGPRPSQRHSLDRVNVNGNYDPGNCRWAIPRQQQRNRTNNIRLTVDGETKTASEWAEVVGVSQKLIARRIRSGWSPERAVREPPMSLADAARLSVASRMRRNEADKWAEHYTPIPKETGK